MNSNEIRELRQRLVTELKALIRTPVIEEKELAAVDFLMSRRQFLKGSQLAPEHGAGVWQKVRAKLRGRPEVTADAGRNFVLIAKCRAVRSADARWTESKVCPVGESIFATYLDVPKSANESQPEEFTVQCGDPTASQ